MYPFVSQPKIERGENFLNHYSRYSTSLENIENEKAYTERENRYFLCNSDIKNCFPIIYKICS